MKTLQLELLVPDGVVLRTAIQALQATDANPISTPVDWKPGDRVIVAPTLSTEDARAKFGEVEEVKPYLRYTAQP